MRLVYFNHPEKVVSGGHKYNEQLLQQIKSETDCEIVLYPQLRTIYPGWRQLFAPLLELNMLSRFKRGDVIFWGDTTYKYHLLLLFLTKVFLHTTNVTIIHHFPFLELNGAKRYIYEKIQILYYSLSHYIIVPSPFTKDIAEKVFLKKKVVYIPLPFSTHFTPSQTYKAGQLLYVGTTEPRKGLHLLLQSLVILRDEHMDFSLNIIGKIIDQKYKDTLDTFIEANQLTEYVHFAGRVSDEELEHEINNAEVFSFPSLLEGYGIVLVEAMRQGLPIVAFNNSAMPYSIKSGYNGLLAIDKDPQDFAVQLKKILGNRELRQTLQKGMKETVRNLKCKEDFNCGISSFCKLIN